MKQAKKGDRVACTYNGEKRYGVVERGGKNKITITLDGGVEQLKGHVSLFAESEHPLPTDPPNVMDKWSVKNYKEINGHGDTPTFNAIVCLDGKPVIEAMNDGWGGPNQYHTLRGVDRSVLENFINDAKEWANTFGCTHHTEIESIWLEWYVLKRPYGVTAKQELAEFEKIFS